MTREIPGPSCPGPSSRNPRVLLLPLLRLQGQLVLLATSAAVSSFTPQPPSGRPGEGYAVLLGEVGGDIPLEIPKYPEPPGPTEDIIVIILLHVLVCGH